MTDIPTPATTSAYVDRSIDLQFHLALPVINIASKAKQAGWSEAEVTLALIQLAHNYARVIFENGNNDFMIPEVSEMQIGIG